MRTTSFLTYFTSGYGICWLCILILSLVTQSHVETGSFGFYGFPLLSLFYAVIRRSVDAGAPANPGC